MSKLYYSPLHFLLNLLLFLLVWSVSIFVFVPNPSKPRTIANPQSLTGNVKCYSITSPVKVRVGLLFLLKNYLGDGTHYCWNVSTLCEVKLELKFWSYPFSLYTSLLIVLIVSNSYIVSQTTSLFRFISLWEKWKREEAARKETGDGHRRKTSSWKEQKKFSVCLFFSFSQHYYKPSQHRHATSSCWWWPWSSR